MRKASAIKTKFGYKAMIVRDDGSTLRATKCFATKAEAVASAQLWVENIEAKSVEFNTPRQPFRFAAAIEDGLS
jgi:hypothetical protein